ncbi:MAG: DUF1080 domain-containing protein [Verrucomicrobiota bacterium]
MKSVRHFLLIPLLILGGFSFANESSKPVSEKAAKGNPAKASKSVNLSHRDAWTEPAKWRDAAEIAGSPVEKKWKKVKSGKGIIYNGSSGKAGDLVSKASFGDCEIDVEFMIPKGSNSGLYLMCRYEVQILDSFGKADGELGHGDCGGIYQRWDETKEKKSERGYEGTPPRTNASAAPGAWQRFRIQFRAPRFDPSGNKTENARFVRVVHNGVIIHTDVEVTGPTRGGAGGPEVTSAPLRVQGDHGPVAIRKLVVKSSQFD